MDFAKIWSRAFVVALGLIWGTTGASLGFAQATGSIQGSAMLGHSDRTGLRDDAASRSWNSAHPSRGPDGGCSQIDLRSTGGDGLLYCFAAN